jgi:adenylate kinase family enzyme
VNDNSQLQLNETDVTYIRNIVRQGLLLENDTFYLAKRIFDAFMERHTESDPLLILNGLPRHTGQAEAIADMVEVIAIISLNCSATVVAERIAMNSGGDRTHRTDDGIQLVKQKLETFNTRTRPLLRYYEDRHVPLVSLNIKSDSTAESTWDALRHHATIKRLFR